MTEFINTLSDYKICGENDIDFSNGLISMSKSLRNLEEYITNIKWDNLRNSLKAIESQKKNISTIEDYKKLLGRKHKTVVEQIVRLIESVKWRYESFSINPISTTNADLMKLFKNKMGVSRVITNAIKAGVLICVNRYSNSFLNQAKQYYLNEEKYNELKKLYKCKTNKHIEKIEDEEDEMTVIRTNFDKSRIKISSRIGMNIDGISDNQIIEILNEKYPMFVDGKKIADELNEKLPDEQKIKWEWTIKRVKRNGSEYLSKIGFRASNTVCTFKEHENNNPFYKGKWRKDYLNEQFGEGQWDNYDINGSIWRLTYNLNHEEPIGFDKDIYNEIWKHYNEESFKDKTERDAFKYISMRLYFGKQGDMGKNFVWSYNKLLSEIGYELDDKSNKIEACQAYLESFKENSEEYLGQYYGSEIFLYESGIYLNMLKEMINDSKSNIVQVYDSFYFSNNLFSIEYLNELYIKCLNEYKIKYLNNQNKSNNNINHIGNIFKINNKVYHIGNTFAKSNVSKSRKIRLMENDDIPDDESQNVDDRFSKFRKLLNCLVQKSMISVDFANSLVDELYLGDRFTIKDQRFGFTVTNHTIDVRKKVIAMSKNLKNKRG